MPFATGAVSLLLALRLLLPSFKLIACLILLRTTYRSNAL